MFAISLKNGGFTLIEVLVTLLILAIGLLGLAGLHTTMLRTELEALQRTQATLLLEDMANRLRSNPAQARANAYLGEFGVGTNLADCGSPVNADKCAWDRALDGAAVENSDGDNIGAMIGARGCVEHLSGGANTQVLLRVTVAWQGLSPTVAPELSCGEGDYGDDDSQRRAVSVVVALAYLGV
ncbi:type IV pilus assembly protein PilV [Pseudomonas fluvialis]|uniref:Type IV pilus assembly protein PilV n=1 Tax=Pseudomonas fluvialis TaxID=1793966 RepID=A0A7X0BR31_9PSED|nr:type IV pilus modification protein PilV [Pseudomonas fluvialis]MBB6341230.1 type IV pilus assembly protein PilV [Pseudomonas fluvialis]